MSAAEFLPTFVRVHSAIFGSILYIRKHMIFEQTSTTRRYVASCVFILIALTVRFLLLDSYALMDRTESRYAEISREMIALGDWITPRLDPNTPFWGKPPLSFWCTAISFSVFGVNEFAARLPSFLLSLGTLVLTMVFAYRAFNLMTSMLSGIILVTTALFYVHAGFVSTDNAFGFCTTFSLVSVGFALTAEKRRIPYWLLLGVLGMSLAVLAKGLLAVVLFIGPLILGAVTNKQIRSLWTFKRVLAGLFTCSIIVLPWHLLAEQKTPGFLEYYVIGEHLDRFLYAGWKGNLYGKSHAEWYGIIWLYAVLSFFPWCLPLLYITLSQRRATTRLFRRTRHHATTQLLMYWLLLPLLFFSGAGNVLIPYTYPSLPAFSILTACILLRRQHPYGSASAFRLRKSIIACSLVVPIAFSIAALCILPRIGERRSQRLLIHSFQQRQIVNRGELIYLTSKPYSADFYLGEDAKDSSDSVEREIQQALTDNDADCFVIRKDETNAFKAHTPQVAAVASYGKYLMLCEDEGVTIGRTSTTPQMGQS